MFPVRSPQEPALKCEDRLDDLRSQSILAPMEMAVPWAARVGHWGLVDPRCLSIAAAAGGQSLRMVGEWLANDWLIDVINDGHW